MNLVMLRRALRQAVLLVALGAILGTAANLFAPWRIPWIARQTVLEAASDSLLLGSLPAARPGEGVAKPLSITLPQAKALFDRRAAIFVDARPPYEYDEGHIAGAVNIPWEEIEYYETDIAQLPRDSTVVVYCAGKSCDLSQHLGDELATRGFRKVRVFFGGWVGWNNAKYPVEKP